MEIGGNNININSMLGHHNSAIGGTSTRGQNGNSTPNLAWDICGELNTNNSNTTTTRTNNNNNNNNSNLWYSAAAAAAATTLATAAEEAYAGGPHSSHQQYYHPDPHLMCLKLGKRHYFEDASSSAAAPPPLIHRHVEGFPLAVAVAAAAGKRGKQQQQLYGGGGGGGGALSSKVARCQVEGCHVALVNAKEYHRRHKVCEMHSKASKVVVLGMEQRFCQQCSRFHVVSEFDESKRSCRRRLAGHNERRRKSSHDSLPRNSSQDNKLMGASRFPAYLSSSSTGRVLSLLSSKADSGVSPSDLSSRSSAALRELIAENRAAIWARQLISDRSAEEYFGADHGQSWSNSVESHHHHNQMYCDPHDHGWERFHESSIGSHLTLDLMQTPSPAGYGFLPANARAKTKAEEEECDLWNSFQGASMV